MTSQNNQPGRRDDPERAEPPVDALLLQAIDRFRQAAAGCGGPIIRRFRIGGKGVELHFASEPLLELLTPPLSHLAVTDSDDRPFVVRLWDTASTGVKPPAPVWTLDQYGPRGDLRCGLRHQLHASYSVDAGMLSLFDAGTGHAVCWVRDPERIPAWDLAAPLRPIFAWWASATKGQLTHGAAVGDRGFAVLLTAMGGSGKSTTALACLDSGLSYLGDDYVMLRSGEPPMVCSLYNTAKLAPDHLRQTLPHLGGLVLPETSTIQDKVTIQIKDSHPSQLVSMLPLCAVLITEVASNGRTVLGPASRSEVLRAMAPTTIFQLPGAGAVEFGRMAEIIRQVSCHRLLVGTDIGASVAAIRSVIDSCALGLR